LSIIGIIFFALIILWVIYRLRQNQTSGMRLVFALLVFLPYSLRIDLPAGLPQLTIHRILIVIAFLFLIRNRSSDRKKWPIPNMAFVMAFGFSQFMSFILGTDLVLGLKNCFNYAIEVVLFYLLISEYVQSESDWVKLLSSICYGLAAVAVVASMEKYFCFDMLGWVMPSNAGLFEEGGDIAATYPHRILLGYAMAMGVPLSLALAAYFKEARPRRIMYGITLLLIAATYFSMSRGPWLGLGLGLLGMVVLGGRKLRKKLAFVAVLTAAILLLRPGVRDTISNLCFSTFNDSSDKASTYNYRWQLWAVAWDQLRLSPVRFLFGYGPGSTENMDLSNYWHGQEGWQADIIHSGHTSWDNNYAGDLIELGTIGFLLELTLFLSISKTLVMNWHRSDMDDRVLQAGIAVACLIFMYSMTNVYIFAPQLKYLFWALVAIGSNLSLVLANQSGCETMLASESSSESITGAASLTKGEATI
jgi:O-antigen ligase